MRRTFRTAIGFTFLVCALLFLSFGVRSTQAIAANRAYWATALTGGYAGCLDKIDGADLAAGDLAIVNIPYYTHIYALWESGSPVTEDSPRQIVPDTNPGNKCWMLTGLKTIDVSIGDPQGGQAWIYSEGIDLFCGTYGTSPPIGSTCAGWTLGAGWACGGSTTILKNSDGTGTCVYDTAPEAGEYYKVSIYISALSGGSLGVSFGNVALPSISSPDWYTYYVVADGTGKLTLTPSATGVRATLSDAFIEDLQPNAFLWTEGQIYTHSGVQVGLGSPLHPSFASQKDSDTGFWFAPEGNQINVSTGGLQRFSLSDGSFKVFEDFTNSSNYEYWDFATAPGSFTISGQTAGTGTDNIDIAIQPAGTGLVHWKETGTLKQFTYQGSVDDDAGFSLPANTNGGFGIAQFGNGEEYGFVSFTSAGVVTLISNSTNCVNTDTDEKACIFDGGSTPTVRNRLGSSKNISVIVWLN